MECLPDPDVVFGEDVVCLASDDWWYHDPQSTRHLMQAFARNGNRVLFVNSTGLRAPSLSADPFAWKRIRKKLYSFARLLQWAEPRLLVFTPFAFPVTVRGRRVALALNRMLLPLQLRVLGALLGFQRPILWVGNPALRDVAIALRRKWAKCLVYYCVDNFTRLTGADPELIREMDGGLQATADFTLFTGRKLFDERRGLNQRTHLLPHGVEFLHFAPASRRPPEGEPHAPLPHDIRHVPKPIAGYIGTLRNLDFELVRSVAMANPDVSIVLIGDVYARTDPLAGLPNVFMLGHKPYAELPSYLAAVQCCCLFYRAGEAYNDYRSPKKLLEYLATGRPVVSLSLRELDEFGDCVYVASEREQFSGLLRAALCEDDPERRERRIRRAAARDWSVVAREASHFIRQVCPRAQPVLLPSVDQRSASSA